MASEITFYVKHRKKSSPNEEISSIFFTETSKKWDTLCTCFKNAETFKIKKMHKNRCYYTNLKKKTKPKK